MQNGRRRIPSRACAQDHREVDRRVLLDAEIEIVVMQDLTLVFV
jgi:hypothetical protein